MAPPIQILEDRMRRAIALAERGGGATTPNPMVGCVLVDDDGRILGEGWHARAGGPHAEVVAIESAREAGRDTAGATAIVTLEPCAAHVRTPPCTEALVAAGVSCVVYGVRDPHMGRGGEERLREAGVEVEGGVLADATERLNEAWLTFVETGRPFLHLKVALTLSGHVARGTGKERWITGPDSRAAVHRLRRLYPAVLVGIGTALADDPLLTVRDWPPAGGAPDDAAADRPWPAVQPLRVVLDSGLRLATRSNLARTAGSELPVLVFCADDAPADRAAALAAVDVEVARMPRSRHGLDLEAVLKELARREVTGVLAESGPTLAAALLEAGFCDRWTAYIAPDADVADDAIPLYAPEGPLAGFSLRSPEWTCHGRDVAVTGRPRRAIRER